MTKADIVSKVSNNLGLEKNEVLKKGKSRLVINTKEEKIENFISSKPNAVANKLHEFGLRKDIQSIEIKQDTLEDIVLSEIKKNES